MNSVFAFKLARCMCAKCGCCLTMGEPRTINVLNREQDAAASQAEVILDGEELAATLKEMMMDMTDSYIKDTGKVDYKRLRRSDAFEDYCLFSTLLRFVNFDRDLRLEAERKAFFINVYNCLTIHALASQPELPGSPADIRNMWSANAYDVGGMILSLDDIEHGILRENRGHPVKQNPMFPPDDPRNALVVKLDPRIHFALNCGAKSCPPIKVYSANLLETQLTQAAAAFNGSSVEVDHKKRKVTLSKLFLWYREDFGSTDGQVLEMLASFLGDDDAAGIRYAMSSKYGIQYSRYDWKLNAHK